MNTLQSGSETGLREDYPHPKLSECSRPAIGGERWKEGISGRLMICHVDELYSHPSYVRHGITVSTSQLSALAELGDLAFRDPLVITQDHRVLDGYARWKLARLQGRLTLPCIEYQLTEQEGLHRLLQLHRRSNGLNAFSRILLALELEANFKEQAQSNQRAGGQGKGLSKLTEAQRLDVRSEIAAAAGVGRVNVTKVKQLLRAAIPALLQALRRGDISIHRAWQLSKQPAPNQREELALAQCKRNIKKDMRALASPHGSKNLPIVPDTSNLIQQLSALESSKSGSFRVLVSNAQGRAVCLTKELLLELGAQKELIPRAKEPVVKADIG